MKKQGLFIFLLGLSVGSTTAQEIQFSASADPRVLRVGEQFSITYESDRDISDLQLPDLNDFQFLGGPSIGQSTQIDASPGRTYTKTTYTYTYYLRAIKEGKHSVKPATAKYKGKSLQSNALTIEVISGSTPSQQNPQANQSATQSPSQDDIFVRLFLNKKEAFIGEQLIATVKLYTKLPLSGIDERYKGPDFTGFYTEQMAIPPLRNLERENVDGDIFYTGVLQKVLLIPQKSGTLSIESFELDVAVRQQVRRRSTSIFDEFFEPSVRDIPMKLKSKPVAIQVKPLPPGKTESFTGAVGEFSMQASLDKNQVKTNDAVNYKLTISGTGNFKIVDEPLINLPPDLEKYDPVVKTSSDNPVKGSKTFEYLLIPHYPGSYTIPAVAFSYFDVRAKQYKTIYSTPFTLQVVKGENDSLPAVVTGFAKEDVKLLNSDIQYIKLRRSNRFNTSVFLISDPRYYLFFAGLTLLFGMILWIRRNQIRRSGDQALVRNRKANRYAQKRLKKSAQLLKLRNKNAFYDELHKAIWLYLSDKLMIPIADLSKESAQRALQNAKVREEVVRQLTEVMNDCEYARYAPFDETVQPEQLYESTVKLLTRLHQELK